MGPAGRTRYRLLGPVEVESTDGPVSLGGHRQRRLLVALLLESGRPLSTDRLCELLWNDEQPSHPAAALRSQIARLRRSLSAVPGEVRLDANGYRLDVPSHDVDVHRFTTLIEVAGRATDETAVDLLDEALALWRGPVAVELSDCPFRAARSLASRRCASPDASDAPSWCWRSGGRPTPWPTFDNS